MKFTKSIATVLLASIACFGQATLSSTSLSAAMTNTDTKPTLASTSSINVGDFLFVDQELMRVTALSPFTVTRGVSSTARTAHIAGVTVYFGGLPATVAFDQVGACTATSIPVLPVINTKVKALQNCINGEWVTYGNGLSDYPKAASLFFPSVTVTTLTTTSAATLTAAQVLGGLIKHDPSGGAATDTFPTAALLVAAIPGVRAGNAFQTTIRNTADASETITVAAGSGGSTTGGGTMTIAQNNQKTFLVRITNATPGSEAYVIESMGTVVF